MTGSAFMSRAEVLQRKIQRPGPVLIVEAHNGLSARLVEHAGFEVIWASGLTIASALGVRDANEASWSEVLNIVEFMADSVTIPILFDGDTGHGNFNNVRVLVRKLCDRNVAGIVLEDKTFPKMNSFVDDSHELEDVDVFCGKIAAAVDHRVDPNFLVVARTEALIAGHGLEEALRRATAYRNAGADAIFIHSRKKEPGEIRNFLARWDCGTPIIVAPTTYSAISFKELEALGVSGCIVANHLLRASARAMDALLKQLTTAGCIQDIEDRIWPLNDVFELLDYPELEAARRRYLPPENPLCEKPMRRTRA